MIWPFSASNKTTALSELPAAAPTLSRAQQAQQKMLAFKDEVLALEFIHTSEEDATTRGRFIAVMDRMLTLANEISWQGSDGTRILESSDALFKKLLNRLHGSELAMSFTETMLWENQYNTTAFVDLARHYGWMKDQPKQAHKAIEAASEQEEDEDEVVRFPAFFHPDEALRQQVAELAAAWQVRSDQELSAEDRYLVNALATSYLPESIRLFTSLCKDPELAPQAEEMFRQQITLLRQRLLTIEDLTAKRQLEAMAVHSAFLEERLRADPVATERLSIAR